jgi:Periplasmic binding protein
MLTELGRANVFRLAYREEATGVAAGNYLADHWSGKNIAILHDNTVMGKGLAELAKEQSNRRGLRETIYQAYVPGRNNYGDEIDHLQEADIAVVFIGGYHTEVALMARAARDRGYPVQLVGGTLGTEEFGLIAGPAADGALFLDLPDARRRADAAPVVERFRGSGYEPELFTLYAYGAVQVWAQAAQKARSLHLEAMIASLRQRQFDTVLGPRSTSTTRAISPCKTRFGGSGGAALTCRWSQPPDPCAHPRPPLPTSRQHKAPWREARRAIASRQPVNGIREGRLRVRYCPPGHLTAVSAAEGEAAEIAGKQT